MGIDLNTILAALTIIGVVGTAFYGSKFAKYRKLLKDVVEAAEDKKVTDEEFNKIVADIKDIVGIETETPPPPPTIATT